jgi:hypothetical protein
MRRNVLTNKRGEMPLLAAEGVVITRYSAYVSIRQHASAYVSIRQHVTTHTLLAPEVL